MIDRLRQRKRFYFHRDQLLLVGCAFALAAAIIFFLGGLTGKTIARRRIAERAASVVKIPVDPPTTETNFPPGAYGGDGAASEQAFTKTEGEKSSVKEQAEETKPERTATKAETAGPPAAMKEPTLAAPNATPAKTPEKNAPAQALREESKISPPATGEFAYAMWTVQVRSSSDKKFAESWVDRLRSKGYDAFIVEDNVKGQTWYRVRVGLLAAREEAEVLQNILATKEALDDTVVLQAVN